MEGPHSWAKKVKIVNLLYASSATVLGYDYLLTLDREVRLIWLSPWSYTKLLFILTRYSPIIATCLLLRNQLFPVRIPQHTCDITWAAAAWLLMIATNSSEVILMIRTWAVWGRDRRVGICCISLITVAIIMQCYYTAMAVNSVEINSRRHANSDHVIRGCAVTPIDSDIFFVNMIASCIIDTVILVLMAISAFRYYKSKKKSHLASVVHRDSLVFYAYLICLVLVEPIIMARKVDLDRDPGLFLMILVQGASYSILTCRIIFNIRSAGEIEDTSVELHATLTIEFPIDEGLSGDMVSTPTSAAAERDPRELVPGPSRLPV